MLVAREEVDRVLAELGALVGAPLRLDAQGVIALEFADDVTCTLSVPEGTGRTFIEVVVVRVPRVHREAVLAAALGRNRFGLDVLGACLALDEAGEHLLLCHSLPADREALASLHDTLAALIADALELRSLIHREAAPAVHENGGTASPGSPGSFEPTVLFRG